MAEQDILMQQRQQDGSYNQLHPITKASNVNYTNSALSGVDDVQGGLDSIVSSIGNINNNLGNYFTKTQTLTSATSALFGKDGNAVPNDIFKVLSAATLQRTANQPKYNEVTIDLSTAQVGDIINLPFNGVMTPHIVVNVGNPDTGLYDSSCNGVWLLMQDTYEKRPWHSSNSNSYKASTIHSYLNGTFLNLFEADIREAIKQVKIPYVNGTANSAVASGSNGLSCKIFLLSGYEVGFSTSNNQYFPVDGAKLSYFSSGTSSAANNKRIAKYNGSATSWWLRSPYTDNPYYAWFVTSGGDCGNGYCSGSSYGTRPAFIMPTTFATTVYADDDGNVYDAQEYYTEGGLYDVLGNLLLTLPGVQIETGSYVGTGTYGESNPNSLTFGFEPKLVIIYQPGSALAPGYGATSYNSPLFAILGNNPVVQSWSQNAATQWGLLTGEWANKTFQWYGDDYSTQRNDSGAVFVYIAIG